MMQYETVHNQLNTHSHSCIKTARGSRHQEWIYTHNAVGHFLINPHLSNFNNLRGTGLSGVISAPPPHTHTQEEMLRSALHDINSRLLLEKPLSGKLREGLPWRAPVTQVDERTEVLFIFAQGPVMCMCVCACADHIIARNYILSGGFGSTLFESPSANK